MKKKEDVIERTTQLRKWLDEHEYEDDPYRWVAVRFQLSALDWVMK